MHTPPHQSISNPPQNYASVKDFYNAFNLVNTDHAYFSFTELQEICHLDGMERWEKVMNPNDQVELHFYLRCFLPSGKRHFQKDFDWIEKMFFSLFVSEEDHESIREAMATAPMMGLFFYKRTNNDSSADSI